jgi:hypothetical protein
MPYWISASNSMSCYRGINWPNGGVECARWRLDFVRCEPARGLLRLFDESGPGGRSPSSRQASDLDKARGQFERPVFEIVWGVIERIAEAGPGSRPTSRLRQRVADSGQRREMIF